MGVFKNLSIGKSKKKLESEIQAEILSGLENLLGASFDRINNVPVYNEKYKCYRRPGKYSRKGTSDIIGCYNGRFVAIEVKTEKEYNYYIDNRDRIIQDAILGKVMSKKDAHLSDQIFYQEDKIEAGGICFFTCSLDHVLKKLGEIN